MAKLLALPELDIISGFRGVIDFYVNFQTCPTETGELGQPCARRWPRSPGHRRAAAVEAQWQDFTIATQAWNELDKEIKDAYRAMSAGSSFTGKDIFMRSYLSGLYAYPQEPPP